MSPYFNNKIAYVLKFVTLLKLNFYTEKRQKPIKVNENKVQTHDCTHTLPAAVRNVAEFRAFKPVV